VRLALTGDTAPAMKTELLTLMITPAVLISACGLMVLATTNRYARVIDRLREIDLALEEMLRTPAITDHEARMALRHRQIDVLRRRGVLLQRAMLSLVGGVALFVLASLSTVISYTLMEYSIVLPLGLVMAGMLSFLGAAIMLLLEIRLSFRVIEQDLLFTEMLEKRLQGGA
jgi:hypothetical protein